MPFAKPFVRPDVANILAMLAAQPGPKLSEISPAEGRAMMQGMGQLMERPIGEMAMADLAIPGPAGSIPARLYTPENAGSAVVVFYHGGGWVIGDLGVYDSVCAEIARQLGLRVVSVDYRLAPEAVFPAATEDCIAATRWVAGSPAELGGAVSGIIPAGDSAGGNLAAAVTSELVGTLPVPILAQWLIYPATDMTATEGSMVEFAEGYLLTKDSMDWFHAHFMKGSEGKLLHPWASPLHAETLAGLPPALVFTCGLDPLRDQGRAYAARLIEHGVRTIYREAAGQIHGCITLRAGIPSAQDDLTACITDLKLLLAGA
ncbi:esterase [Sandarakinorhabdus cyanobacteriorum]|uniref:Esterase n=1 Tax=Sandarakinorhabdus cyanobacteriorum TaxID=1981098 RepID=A0A255YEM7_9SPHN|nr:alpha/beta hydrolase [Sandarakinorhabdus cyanobacteriorum]OYQ27648.1 esterase [Sandarakinorhabdus cyanobacteriorum]